MGYVATVINTKLARTAFAIVPAGVIRGGLDLEGEEGVRAAEASSLLDEAEEGFLAFFWEAEERAREGDLERAREGFFTEDERVTAIGVAAEEGRKRGRRCGGRGRKRRRVSRNELF